MISRRKLAETTVDRLLAGDDQTTVIKQLAAYMIVNRLEDETDRLIADINSLLSSRGRVLARVTTARELDEDSRQQITQYLKQLSGQAAKIQIEELVDPSLVGGAIIETPDKRLDISVAGRLKQLRSL